MKKYFTQGQSIIFIEKVFGEGKTSNAGKNFSVVCPICRSLKGSSYNNKKLVIETSNFVLHCWVCGYKSRNLFHLISKFHPSYLEEYKEKFLDADQLGKPIEQDEYLKKAVFLPEDFRLIVTAKENSYSEKFISYLKKRNITQEDLWYWKFGFAGFKNKNLAYRVIIPSFDKEGIINYYTARTISDIKPKYVNPDCSRESIIFNEININWKKELTLVEGPFDLIKCNENATCVLGSTIDGSYELFHKIIKNKTPLLLAFDRDAQVKTLKIAKFFHEWGISVRIYNIPEKYEDVGEMSKKEFKDGIENANIYNRNFALKYKLKGIV